MKDALSVFYQFGFKKLGTSGEKQVYGDCIFCGKENKFYVNKESKEWDCKSASCNSKGGFKLFLKRIFEKFCLKQNNKEFLKQLSLNRSIDITTLERNKIGYNSNTSSFIVPCFSDNSSEIINFIHYDLREKTPKATAGCSLGLFGWQNLKSDTKIIWLCEGIWDYLVMEEILFRLKKKNEIAIGVPGATILKDEWINFFRNKIVLCCYDKDKAGMDGNEKARKVLLPVIDKIHFIHWPDNKKEGYDLRDCFIENKQDASTTIRNMKAFLRASLPDYYQEKNSITEENSEEKIELKAKTLKQKSSDEIYTAFRKWLYLPNIECIDILFGTILANKYIEGDPVWIFFVAPPGGTKSELINSCSDAEMIEPLSSLTPHTLISGMKFEGGGDPSLLPKLDGKILIINDFTVILNMNKIARDEILGTLRDAYGGNFSQAFGNGQWRKYKSKFGIIAGVTPVIEQYINEHVSLGERFLRYNMPIDNSIKARKNYINKALENATEEIKMRSELKSFANSILDTKISFNDITLQKSTLEKISALSQLTSMLRGTVLRDKYSKEIVQRPFIELGTRLAKQFCKLIYGIMMFKQDYSNKAEDNAYSTIKKVALSSVPGKMEYIIEKIVKHDIDKNYAIKEISEMTKLPNMTISRACEDLYMVELLQKDNSNPLSIKWKIRDEVKELIAESEVY